MTTNRRQRPAARAFDGSVPPPARHGDSRYTAMRRRMDGEARVGWWLARIDSRRRARRRTRG
jgi:hypothetical protein